MAVPTVATKMFVPAFHDDLVRRPRLNDRLNLGSASKLTLVSAPPGFGKTTALAQMLDGVPQTGCSVAWVSLDATDSHPAQFWTYVATALEGASAGTGSSALELLAATHASPALVVTTLLNGLAATPGRVWLVLDDYHLVDSQQIADDVAFMLDRLPPHVHVVISTRSDPDLPLSRWRVRGELAELRAVDLRFTAVETAAYLNEAADLHLTVENVAMLETRTEGWIAALQLAALSLRGRSDPGEFIARFAGNDRYVVDYLVDEVLNQLPEDVRVFLFRTSVLTRLCGPLCDALTGGDRGHLTLQELERTNLFLIPLDDQRDWYRYHHLFADVLRSRLRTEHPGEDTVLHQRASHWFDSHNYPDEAIRHALSAQDHDQAARLMELALPSIRRGRQDTTLIGWLRALPEERRRRSLLLSVFHGWMLMSAGDLDGAERSLQDAEQALQDEAHDPASPPALDEERRKVPATIAVYRASIAQARGDPATTTLHAQRALNLTGPLDHLERGAAAGFLGLAAWARGDVDSATATFTEAIVSLAAAGHVTDAQDSTVLLSDMWLAAGRPSTARRLLKHALDLAGFEGGPAARSAAGLHVALGELDREAGDLREAGRRLADAATIFDLHPQPAGRRRWYEAMADLAHDEGDLAAAVRLLEKAEQAHRAPEVPEVRSIAARLARVHIAQGRLAEVEDWARDRCLSVSDDPEHLREYDHLTLVRLLLARHRTQPGAGSVGHDAALLLDRLLPAAEASRRARSVLEIRLLRALVHQAQGDLPHAHRALAAALTEAPEPAGHAAIFLDAGAPMVELLRAVHQHGFAADRAAVILNLTERRATEPADATRPSSSALLSPRELEVLALLDGHLTGPEMASALFISLNTLRAHTKHIFTKLEVTNRRAAVLRARDLGLV